jgi:hypothetical protein
LGLGAHVLVFLGTNAPPVKMDASTYGAMQDKGGAVSLANPLARHGADITRKT